MGKINTTLWTLKCRLREKLFLYPDVAEKIGKSESYVRLRMRGLDDYEVGEAYKILEMIDEPPEAIVQYFPPPAVAKKRLKVV